jgi:hypothetical protein
MTDQPPSPREVIAEEFAKLHVLRLGLVLPEDEYSHLTDGLLEALRTRGYVVVPREPTEEMLGAGENEIIQAIGRDRPTDYLGARQAWPAMIDAANPGGGGKG